jgi:hypothetical protein
LYELCSDVDRDGKYKSGTDISLSDFSYDGPEVDQTSLSGGSVTTGTDAPIRCEHSVTLGNGAVVSNDTNLSAFQ